MPQSYEPETTLSDVGVNDWRDMSGGRDNGRDIRVRSDIAQRSEQRNAEETRTCCTPPPTAIKREATIFTLIKELQAVAAANAGPKTGPDIKNQGAQAEEGPRERDDKVYRICVMSSSSGTNSGTHSGTTSSNISSGSWNHDESDRSFGTSNGSEPLTASVPEGTTPASINNCFEYPQRQQQSVVLPSKVVHVRNVAETTNESDLIFLALPFGRISNVLILKGKKQALIEMESSTAAKTLIDHLRDNDVNVGGRKLLAQFSTHHVIRPSTLAVELSSGPFGQSGMTSQMIGGPPPPPPPHYYYGPFKTYMGGPKQVHAQMGFEMGGQGLMNGNYYNGQAHFGQRRNMGHGDPTPSLYGSHSALGHECDTFYGANSCSSLKVYMQRIVNEDGPMSSGGFSGTVKTTNDYYPVSADTLRSIFGPYGHVTKVVTYHPEGGRPTNSNGLRETVGVANSRPAAHFATVHFERGSCARRAKESLNDCPIYNGYARLKVDYYFAPEELGSVRRCEEIDICKTIREINEDKEGSRGDRPDRNEPGNEKDDGAVPLPEREQSSEKPWSGPKSASQVNEQGEVFEMNMMEECVKRGSISNDRSIGGKANHDNSLPCTKTTPPESKDFENVKLEERVEGTTQGVVTSETDSDETGQRGWWRNGVDIKNLQRPDCMDAHRQARYVRDACTSSQWLPAGSIIYDNNHHHHQTFYPFDHDTNADYINAAANVATGYGHYGGNYHVDGHPLGTSVPHYTHHPLHAYGGGCACPSQVSCCCRRYDNYGPAAFVDTSYDLYANVQRMGAAAAGSCWSTPVLLASNLSPEMTVPDRLFNLFGAFGDVQRVKVLFNKRDAALIQLTNGAMAQVALRNLDKLTVFGRVIRITPSVFAQIEPPRNVVGPTIDVGMLRYGMEEEGLIRDYETNEGDISTVVGSSKGVLVPESGDTLTATGSGHCAAYLGLPTQLTRDYSNSPYHRFRNFGSKNYKNIYPPSATLHLSNIPERVVESDIVELFTASGFEVKSFRFLPTEKRMALINMASKEEAVKALILLHNATLKEKYTLKVSFARLRFF